MQDLMCKIYWCTRNWVSRCWCDGCAFTDIDIDIDSDSDNILGNHSSLKRRNVI